MDKVERVIEGPTSEQDATKDLRRWQARHPEIWDRLDEGHIIVDHIRSEHGKTRVQYRAFLHPDDAALIDSADLEDAE
ncbi:hypothetical protein [Enhygromyxa salina]|uniref:hypothetical protein n=1 Tax=Enhygromyxa salina TaxID=215803 RepID=UPI000697610C|nr:hypothetical protein [Enhygromyxa salina]